MRSPGDAILTGPAGEHWRVSRAHFSGKYQPVAPLEAGDAGLYRALPYRVLALRMSEPFEVILSDGVSRLIGRTGDWLIDYGDGSLGIVASVIFAEPTPSELTVALHQIIQKTSSSGAPRSRRHRRRRTSRGAPVAIMPSIGPLDRRSTGACPSASLSQRLLVIYLLSAAAVLCAVLPLGLGWDDRRHALHPFVGVWAVLEVAIICAVALIYWLGHRRDWQGQWLQRPHHCGAHRLSADARADRGFRSRQRRCRLVSAGVRSGSAPARGGGRRRHVSQDRAVGARAAHRRMERSRVRVRLRALDRRGARRTAPLPSSGCVPPEGVAATGSRSEHLAFRVDCPRRADASRAPRPVALADHDVLPRARGVPARRSGAVRGVPPRRGLRALGCRSPRRHRSDRRGPSRSIPGSPSIPRSPSRSKGRSRRRSPSSSRSTRIGTCWSGRTTCRWRELRGWREPAPGVAGGRPAPCAPARCKNCIRRCSGVVFITDGQARRASPSRQGKTWLRGARFALLLLLGWDNGCRLQMEVDQKSERPGERTPLDKLLKDIALGNRQAFEKLYRDSSPSFSRSA